MNKKCAKCIKTVYPTEELKCLDKIWHKACFKCEVCGMTLNMKNYKGYDKLPYCNAHYPTTKHTQVADTPESRRIAENTKIQSQVQYHADFEKQKGFKTSVAEDPETTRIKQNTANQSNVNYWGVKEQRSAMEEKRPFDVDDVSNQVRRQPGSIADYDPMNPPVPREGFLLDPRQGGGGGPQGYQQQPAGYPRPYQAPTAIGEGRLTITTKNATRSSAMQSQGHPGTHHAVSNQGSQGYQQQQARPYQAPPAPAYQQPQRNKGMMCRAMYDYTAADSDEVTFMDGDTIIECQPVDAGWMMGRVERTGQYGMLPSNYVQRIN